MHLVGNCTCTCDCARDAGTSARSWALGKVAGAGGGVGSRLLTAIAACRPRRRRGLFFTLKNGKHYRSD